jgi:hypothetical protein
MVTFDMLVWSFLIEIEIFTFAELMEYFSILTVAGVKSTYEAEPLREKLFIIYHK